MSDAATIIGNCFGNGFSSAGYNLSSTATCGLNQPSDTNNTDPKLGPLQNNGGPNLTVLPEPAVQPSKRSPRPRP